jgi:putative ABC transport system permease protein
LKKSSPIPPAAATRLLRAFLRSDLQEEVVGDLQENFDYDRAASSLRRANFRYWKQVLLYVRPFAIKRIEGTVSNPTDMYRSYLRTAIQNMVKNKLHAFINISGLAIGMAVAIIIGLWMHDEVSYNSQFSKSERIGQVIQNVTNNNEVETWWNIPWPLGDEIRQNYGTDFQQIAMASHYWGHTITIGENKHSKVGMYVEPEFLTMFDVELIRGTFPDEDPSTILISESMASAFYGDIDPVGKGIHIEDTDFQVGGVYRDFPLHSRWGEVQFLMQWSKYVVLNELEQMEDRWRPNGYQLFVMITEKSTFQDASLRIKDAKLKKVNEMLAKKKPALFIIPMEDWHLRSEFSNGVQTGGLIQYVWMFGIVGSFVLLMACINFMNLSTARSEKRAKEVGIRKAVGSYRSQLITQFFSESILTAFVSLLLALGLAYFLLPLFNRLSEKNMALPWNDPLMWIGIVVVSIVIGIVAGSYPALFLSGIRPVGALKGVFKAGRNASIPRKVLVVVQFGVSVMMIIGTSTVFLQIQHGRSRPLGFNVGGLVSVPTSTQEVHDHFDAIRKTLIENGSVIEMAESVTPATSGWGSSSGIDWSGKDPNLSIDFAVFEGSYDYGKTIQWEVLQGRDFSRDFPSDSLAVIMNEAAARYLDKSTVVGEVLRTRGNDYTIIGVIRNVVFGNPYEPVRPSIYFLNQRRVRVLTFRLNPEKPAAASVAMIESALKPHMNSAPFTYEFLDQNQASKFGNEARVSTLASTFAGLAIFISCLGIFGLSSFVAEQRTKEIGLRKVMGANLSQLWMLMSKDFVLLVIISCVIATPFAWWFLQSWLEGYEYRVAVPYWVFIAATAGTLVITMVTISWHMLKVARVNPAQTLKFE